MIPLPGRLVLLGHPVGHSLSPVVQAAALRAAGIALTYEALDVPPAHLDAVLYDLAEVSAAGNVTIPHKSAVASHAAPRLTAPARRTGAVNTFWHVDGMLHGDNTDVAGFEHQVRSALGRLPEAARVALFGAGGAAAAVCAAVESWAGARVLVWNRSPHRAHALAARFPDLVEITHSAADALRGATLVVNTTPVGVTDDMVPVPLALVPRDAAVMDVAYRRGETPLVRAARAAGLRAADGVEMLIAQGALAFERWFGFPPDDGAMRAALAA
jgi:shikimate dehydrogenase